MNNPFSLEGKNAWITGGCYGIGYSIAKAFVGAGASHIIFNFRSEEARDKALAVYALKTSRAYYPARWISALYYSEPGPPMGLQKKVLQ